MNTVQYHQTLFDIEFGVLSNIYHDNEQMNNLNEWKKKP